MLPDFRKFLDRSCGQWILALSGFLLLITLIVHFDLAEILSSFRNLSLNFASGAAICIILSTLLGAINLYILLGQKLRFAMFLRTYWFSWAIGLIVPGQVGDLATLSTILRKRGVDLSVILGTAVVDKVISLLVMGCVAAYGFFVFSKLFVSVLNWQACILISFIVCLAVLWIAKKFEKNLNPGTKGWKGEIGKTVVECIAILKNQPLKILINGLISLLKIILTGCAYWLTFAAFGYNNQLLIETISFATLAGLIAYLPISINGVGSVEACGILLFGSLGIPPREVLASYLLLRSMVLLLAWLPSIVMFLFIPQPTANVHKT